MSTVELYSKPCFVAKITATNMGWLSLRSDIKEHTQQQGSKPTGSLGYSM